MRRVGQLWGSPRGSVAPSGGWRPSHPRHHQPHQGHCWYTPLHVQWRQEPSTRSCPAWTRGSSSDQLHYITATPPRCHNALQTTGPALPLRPVPCVLVPLGRLDATQNNTRVLSSACRTPESAHGVLRSICHAVVRPLPESSAP